MILKNRYYILLMNNQKKKCNFKDCNKKITIYNNPCKCKLIFCKKHSFFLDHNCTYDYKNEHKKQLKILNPKIINKCLEVI